MMETFNKIVEECLGSMMMGLKKSLSTTNSESENYENSNASRRILDDILILKEYSENFLEAIVKSDNNYEAYSSKSLFTIGNNSLKELLIRKDISILNITQKNECFILPTSLPIIVEKFIYEIVTTMKVKGSIAFFGKRMSRSYIFNFYIHGQIENNLNIIEEVDIATLFSNNNEVVIRNIYMLFMWKYIEKKRGKLIINKINEQDHLVTIWIPQNRKE